jgi:hypothetical protein
VADATLSQAMCTNFFSFVFFLTLILFYFIFYFFIFLFLFFLNLHFQKESSLSPLLALPHPSSLWPLSEARSLSLFLPLPLKVKNHKKTFPLPFSLPRSPSLSHSGHRRPPPLTLSHSGARVPANDEEERALLSLPRTCLFLTTAQKISGHRRRLTHETRK